MKYEPRSASDRLNYAMKYYRCLLTGNLSELQLFSESKRIHVMKSLAALSKFLGIYDWWKHLLGKHGLKWGSRSSLEVFLSILNFNVQDTKEWLLDVVEGLPRRYAAVEVYLALTGLRPSEGISSLRLISDLSDVDQLDGYLNEEFLMLEHFRHPKIFLRNCKNAYISFITTDLLNVVLDIRPRIKYAALYSRIRRLGLSNRSKQLRKLHATILRNSMIPSEVVDILQGRINSSIFMRFYYKPFLREIREKAMKAIAPLEKEILSLL